VRSAGLLLGRNDGARRDSRGRRAVSARARRDVHTRSDRADDLQRDRLEYRRDRDVSVRQRYRHDRRARVRSGQRGYRCSSHDRANRRAGCRAGRHHGRWGRQRLGSRRGAAARCAVTAPQERSCERSRCPPIARRRARSAGRTEGRCSSPPPVTGSTRRHWRASRTPGACSASTGSASVPHVAPRTEAARLRGEPIP